MSTIRLSGSSSGYYDLTVPAVAGTNSIDLSKLPVKDSNGNLTEPLRVQVDTDTDFSVGSAVVNTALTLKNSTSGANNPVSLSFSTESNGEVYLSAVQNSSNTAADFKISQRNGGSRTTNFELTAAGYMKKPNHPCFDVASSQGVSASNYQTYNIVYHNVGNHFSTSNNRFTAPISGLYQFFATTIKSGAASGSVSRVYIHVNGSAANGSRHVRLSEGSNYGTNGVGSWIISLSAGDYAQVYMGSGGSHSSTEYTYFNGYLLQ